MSAGYDDRGKVLQLPDHTDVKEAAHFDMIQAKMMSITDVFAIQPPGQLVDGWIDSGMICSIVSQYGALKSFVVLSLGLSVVTGAPWLGQPIRQTGPVVYAALEGLSSQAERIRGWMEHNGFCAEELDDFKVWPENFDLGDEAHIAAMEAWLAVVKPKLVIIDTLSKATPGVDENSKAEMSSVYWTLARLRNACDGTILIVHHTGHNARDRGRGSSMLEADIDIVLAIKGQWKDGKPLTLTSEKQKARENPKPLYIELIKTRSGYPVVVETTAAPDVEARRDDVAELILAKLQRYPFEICRSHLYKDSNHHGHIRGTAARINEVVDALLADGTLHTVTVPRAGTRSLQALVTAAQYIEFSARNSSVGEFGGP
ncbi:MAG: AAA family ATPase [Acidimicrobiales bacterium]